MLDVALEEYLHLFPIGRSGKGDDPEHARAHLLGDGLDGAALAGGIAAFEKDNDPQVLLLDPLLQMTEVDLELAELRLVGLALHSRRLSIFWHQSPQTITMLISPGTPPEKSTIWYLMR